MTQQFPKHCATSDRSWEKQPPNQLTAAEYRELHQGSGIHPDIINLNFFHLEGNTALDRLLISDQLKRINTGVISYSVLKRYRHVETGGWWVSGVDLLNNYSDDLWGQFKPLQPRLSADKGKIIKYEAPPKHPTGVIALKVSQLLWQAVARNNKIKRYLSPLALKLCDLEEIRSAARHHPVSFWEWVVTNPAIPLIITEGAKKAAALLSLGYAAIAIPGIFNGYRQPKDEFGRQTGLAKLIPQLQIFASAGRTVYFAFDRDSKASTIANVNKAIAKTGKLFAKDAVNVKVIRWPEPAKGVDDLIVNHGAEAFHQAYSKALSLETWLVQTQVQLTYPANIRVERRYLGSLAELGDEKIQGWKDEGIENNLYVLPHTPQRGVQAFEATSNDSPSPTPNILNIPDTAKLIGIKSPKGTGKTHLIEQIVERATREGKWVLLLTHRIQLGEALCQRVGLPYLTEIKTVEYGTVLGYGLCIDSLHPNSGARFNADNWEDGVIVIDEAEQVIWHLLNSATCAQERVSILTQFKTLIQNNLSGDGKVYLADADLSDVAIDYIRSLAGFHVEPFVVVNDWQPPQNQRWTIHNYQEKNPARLVQDLVNHIAAGGQPFISCSAQKNTIEMGNPKLRILFTTTIPRSENSAH